MWINKEKHSIIRLKKKKLFLNSNNINRNSKNKNKISELKWIKDL
jgi:hypothetical protein